MERIMSHATDFWHITLDSTWLYSGGWSLFEFDFIFKQDKYVQPVCGASNFEAGTDMSHLWTTLWKTTAKSCLYTSVFIDVLKSIFLRAMCWKALTCIGQSLVSKSWMLCDGLYLWRSIFYDFRSRSTHLFVCSQCFCCKMVCCVLNY